MWRIIVFLRNARSRLSLEFEFTKGASIYDVRTEGERGVSPKEDVVREVA